MGDTSDDVEGLRSRLAAATANAETRIEAMKRQQAEAKAKAKALIQKQRAQARQKELELERENRRVVEELETVKGMLRDAVQEREKVEGSLEALHTLVDCAKQDLKKEQEERYGLMKRLEDIQKENESVKEISRRASEERDEVSQRLRGLQGDHARQVRLGDAEGERDIGESRNVEDAAQKSRDAVDIELDPVETMNSKLSAALNQISDLEKTCGILKTEKLALLQRSERKLNDPSNGLTPESASCDNFNSEIGNELQEAREKLKSLSEELNRTYEQTKVSALEHRRQFESLNMERELIAERLKASEELADQLRSDVRKSEAARHEEREKVLVAQRGMSESANGGEEEKKILEAKVAEMERLVAAKQADNVKLREKARSYLKDISAEKREMEEKMKKQVDSLQVDIVEEQRRAKLFEDKAESAAEELDNCLVLIRDKQKTIQMLKMMVSSHGNIAEEAKKDLESVKVEFNAYKERARLALSEKEIRGGESEAAIKEATSTLQVDLDRARSEVSRLRKEVQIGRENLSKVGELQERAERAEAAVDLLRKDASGVSNATYSQIDALEEKIDTLQNELGNAHTTIENADARYETAAMRLEAAERALRSSEVRAEEASRVAGKTIDALRKQIHRLQKDLDRAEQSSAAAQRTAAAAAKALAFSSPVSEEIDSESPGRDAAKRKAGRNYGRERPSPYSSIDGVAYADATSFGARANLAAALEGHNVGLTSQSQLQRNGVLSSSGGTEYEKDQQIAILSSQVAELSTLLDDVQQDTNLKSEQTALLKDEVKILDAKLAAAEKLQNGAPFSYLRTIVVRYLETDDSTLLPVIANVLSFTEEESKRVKDRRGSLASSMGVPSGSPNTSGYFSLSFLGSR